MAVGKVTRKLAKVLLSLTTTAVMPNAKPSIKLTEYTLYDFGKTNDSQFEVIVKTLNLWVNHRNINGEELCSRI